MDVAYASARDRLGQTLCGKYQLEEVLGVGGTAVVYRATRSDGSTVALKLLHDYLCSSKEVSRRFKREAYLANLLEHPGTVRVLDDGLTDDGAAFLVLEHLEGETLEERRVRMGGRLPFDEVLGYIDGLLEVLELAHEKNIVHRDIKPSNLFLTKGGALKVLDFGIARLLDDSAAATATKTGTMIGTPAFMPPEQALSKPKEIDAKSDIWAVGATLFTLLSGELVHEAESSSEHLVKAATLHARSVASVLRGVPANVETLCSRALAFDKSKRWSTASEMRAALAKTRSEPGRSIGTTSMPPPPRVLSNAPTVVGPPRDSEPASGMSMTGAHTPAPAPTQRRAFVATALAFGAIVATLGLVILYGATERPTAESARAASPPASSLEPTLAAVAPSAEGPVSGEASPAPGSTAEESATPKPATAHATDERAPTTSTTTGARADVGPKRSDTGAPKPTTTRPATTAPKKPTATATPTQKRVGPPSDLYKPF